jgi:hypothetical protein
MNCAGNDARFDAALIRKATYEKAANPAVRAEAGANAKKFFIYQPVRDGGLLQHQSEFNE